jgi:O-methyltransferase
MRGVETQTPMAGIPDKLNALRAWLIEYHDTTVDDCRLDIVTRQLATAARHNTPGAIVDLGCYGGAIAMWIRATLDDVGLVNRAVHVFDSFQGMPPPGRHDAAAMRRGGSYGELDELVSAHRAWGLRAPVIHPGLFSDTLPTQMPQPVSFAYIDATLYQATLTGLASCVPNLSRGAALVVDGYADLDTARSPRVTPTGARRACDEYFGTSTPLEVVGRSGDPACAVYQKPD